MQVAPPKLWWSKISSHIAKRHFTGQNCPMITTSVAVYVIRKWFGYIYYQLSSVLGHVQLLCPHGLQQARLPYTSAACGVYSNSCPLRRWCHPTISSSVAPSPPAFNPCRHQGLFKWVSSLHQVVKYWSFSFSISPSNEYSGLNSFQMDWLTILAVQRTLKSLLQHHSAKASALRCSAFFIVQHLYPYRTTGITIALTRWTFVGKVMSLLINIQFRLV